jgi:iron complex transport system permease protein
MGIEPVSAKRVWSVSGASLILLGAALIVLPLIGSVKIDYARALAHASPDYEILFRARLPRVLLSAIVGGVLATAGVLFQALLRDALATPYTLGVSSGASLGAVLAIVFGWSTIAGLSGLWTAAFLGAGITLLLVMAVASEGRRMSSFTLLLAGVTINSIAIALILFFHNLASFSQSFAITRWLMGGIEPVAYSTLGWLTATTLPVVMWLFWTARDWNLLSIGEEWAAVRGVSTSRLLLIGYITASFLTASVTSFTGPIGFVGLIVPHALRMAFGADHRVLIPASFLMGATFLAICDTIARVVLAPTEIPVGVVTALLGGPFFIWMLRSKRRSLWL